MKKPNVCKCVSGESFNTDQLNVTITPKGISLNYSAFSCDSSFCDEIIEINFCPLCGAPISTLAERVEGWQKLLKELEEIQKTAEKRVFERKQKESREALLKYRLENKVKQNVYTYRTDLSGANDIKIEAYDRKDAQEKLERYYHIVLSNSQAQKNLKCIDNGMEKMIAKSENKKNRELNYEVNKLSKIGTTCVCPACGADFVKASYQQVFCKTKGGTICKDNYWNKIR